MKWLLKDASFGDMVRVKLGDIYHYGIFASDDEVIQFGPPPSQRLTKKDNEIEVIATDIDVFLAGGFLEVAEFDKKEKKNNRTSDEAVAFARSKIGTRGYNILYNNCEHFANECISGIAVCSQADRVRALFRSMPIVDVYTAEIPDILKIGSVFPSERECEIRSVSNERVRKEKYCVWKLLEYALERSLGLKLKKMQLSKTDTGKWIAEECYFSLSHSENAVAVAVSRAPVGVDIERVRATRGEAFARKILTEAEACEFSTLKEDERDSFILEKWCIKEASFKRSGNPLFEPSKISESDSESLSKLVTVGTDSYILAVCTATPEKLRLFENVKLF